jgi:ATP-binding cassette, subfamily C (CFTR/MRP), member 4
MYLNVTTKKIKMMKYRKEINQITKTAYIKATLLSFSVFNTRLALFLSVLLYVVLGNYITASKVK